MIGFLAVRGLFRHRARTFLGILGVGVAGALLLNMQMLSRGLQVSLRGILEETGYEIRVTPRGTLPFETDATFPDGHTIAATIAADPRVEQVAPVLGGTVYVARPGGVPLSAFVYGMDPPSDALWRVLEGDDLAPHDSSRAVISQALAQAAGIGVGDTLFAATEYAAQIGMLRSPRAYVVAGIARFHFDLRTQRSFTTGTLKRRMFSTCFNTLSMPCVSYAFFGATKTAAEGFSPPARHLMLKNFSAPRSAPKPASVTTKSASFMAMRVAMSVLQPCAMLAKGPPCTKAGSPSVVCTRFGFTAFFNSAVIAPAAPI